MFDGITITTLVADLEILLPLVAGGFAIYLVFWGGGKLVRLGKRIMGRG